MRVSKTASIRARQAQQRYLRIHLNANYVSLYSHYAVSSNTFHRKRNNRLQRQILHHPNNHFRNKWLLHQLALLNGQSLV